MHEWKEGLVGELKGRVARPQQPITVEKGKDCREKRKEERSFRNSGGGGKKTILGAEKEGRVASGDLLRLKGIKKAALEKKT